MANRTAKDVQTVHGSNPQFLVEKIIRTRIYECKYWKEECFALTAEAVVDKAMMLDHVGGVFGGNFKPSNFLCLVLKMLQIQPDKDIVIEFIKNEDFKYVRVLGALYLRLVGASIDCYKYLEPLLSDYRKLKFLGRDGKFVIKHVDEFVDDLLRLERMCDCILPRLQDRHTMELNGELEPRMSLVNEDEEDEELPAPTLAPAPTITHCAVPGPPPAASSAVSVKERSERESVSRRDRDGDPRRNRSSSPRRRRSPSSSRSRSRSRSRSPADRRRHRSRSRSPRSRSRSPRRDRDSRSRHESERRGHTERDSDRHRDRDGRTEERKSRDKHESERREQSRSPSPKRDPAPARKSSPAARTSSSSGRHRLRFKGDEKKKSTAPAPAEEKLDEIAEANALRAKLGLKPLRP